jgi:hypothetical protein
MVSAEMFVPPFDSTQSDRADHRSNTVSVNKTLPNHVLVPMGGGGLATAGAPMPPMHHRSMTPLMQGALPAGHAAKTGTLQGDLLHAADNITNTMSTLVRQLDNRKL